MNVVIVGCGRVGAQLAAVLDTEGHKVTILDVTATSFRRLPSTFGGTAIVGDGTDESSLRKAGIERADALVAVTQGDNRNVMSAQIGKHVFKVPKVLCRIYDPLRKDIYDTLGLDAVSPTTVLAQLLKSKLEST